MPTITGPKPTTTPRLDGPDEAAPATPASTTPATTTPARPDFNVPKAKDGFAPSKPKVAGVMTNSLLNGQGAGNVSGADNSLWNNLPGNGREVTNTRDGMGKTKLDPNSVVTNNTWNGACDEVRRIVTGHVGAPKTGELIAKTLAEKYGPFTASNSQVNRDAILANLRWVADTNTGIKYADARLTSGDATTQTPNDTLSRQSGVCRDIHTAMSAVLGSLINAKQVGGKWTPGSPSGQEGNVQTLSFANPSEYHAYMVYKDPATGGWNALEYGKSYALNAGTAVEAFRSLPGYMSGYERYRITGWDSKPVLAEGGAIGAQAARDFMNADAGVGKAGEVRVQGGNGGGSVTGFITDKLSATAEVAPNEMGTGVQGGVKLNYHTDFENADAQGYVRVAGGVYTNSMQASVHTGERGAIDRAEYRTYLLAMKVDGKYEGKPHELIGQHLQGKLGVDADLMLGTPIGSGPNSSGAVWGAVPDFSKASVAAEGTLLGHEQVNKNLSVDWAVRARYDADLVKTGVELVTSDGKAASNLGTQALQTDFAVALTHKSDSGITTRFEAGGSQRFGNPLDAQTAISEDHRAVLTVSPESGKVDFGIVARGDTVNGKFDAVNSIGVALNLRPSKNVEVGVGVQAGLPGGNFSNPNVEVTGGLKIHF